MAQSRATGAFALTEMTQSPLFTESEEFKENVEYMRLLFEMMADAPDIIAPATVELVKMQVELDEMQQAWADLGATVQQQWDDMGIGFEEWANMMIDVSESIKYAVVEMAATFIESMAEIALSSNKVGAATAGLQSLLGVVASIAGQLGRIAIGVGIGIEGIKKALLTLNPAAAIGAGIALLALAGAAKAAIGRIGNFGSGGGGGGGGVGYSASTSFGGNFSNAPGITRLDGRYLAVATERGNAFRAGIT